MENKWDLDGFIGNLLEILLVNSFLSHLRELICWFELAGASWVKFETVPYMPSARKDQRKRSSIPDWQVTG